MTLIKSISGIRGTIGGPVGNNLTPLDTVKFAAAYGTWIKQQWSKEKYRVVVGRDARISGAMVQNLVMNTLIGLGIDVIDLDLSTTPTVEIAVPLEKADGGIILTASHNPKQWNALKLLDANGEFLNAEYSQRVLDIAEADAMEFADVDQLGIISKNQAYFDIHIDEVLDLEFVNVKAISDCKFKVVVDAVNSTGGIAIPLLLERLGVEAVKIHCEPNGQFPHNPEPLKQHLTDLSETVVSSHADFGIAVDPDVDRLAFMDEQGIMFGEEYTLVACADYI
jgi:phosphomannomutase